jgi:hypothetical protein
MDPVALQALEAAAAALRALLPGADGALRAPELVLLPTRVRPVGIGGVVATSREPHGLIVGRTVQATAVVRATTSDRARLDEAVGRVTTALLAGDRAAMRAGGIHDLELLEVGAPTTEGGAPDTVFGRELRFRAVYEHLRLPAADEGVIEQIPIALDVGTGA